MWSDEINYVFQYTFVTLLLLMNYCKNNRYLDKFPAWKKPDYDLLVLFLIPYFAIKYAYKFHLYGS